MKRTFLTVFLISCALLALVVKAQSQSHLFDTLAGESTPGSDDGPGSIARFNGPIGIAVDGAGHVYIADTQNGTIRKISTNNTVTTFAGVAGSFGSLNGTRTNARFYGPQGLAVDGDAVLYVADTANATIRKITADGVVSTLAGNSGDPNSFDGAGTNANFFQPEGLAVDHDGNVCVADTWNHTIRKITPSGVVSTLAGLAGNSGSVDGTTVKARFNRPVGIAVDAFTNLFVVDSLNHTIRRISPSGRVSTIAGLSGVWGSSDGTNSEARFFQPQGIIVDNEGHLLVVDSGNQTIRKISASGTNWIVNTVSGFPGVQATRTAPGSWLVSIFPLASRKITRAISMLQTSATMPFAMKALRFVQPRSSLMVACISCSTVKII